ncbi:unnamed protein product, partial [Iphiclides podalirius]
MQSLSAETPSQKKKNKKEPRKRQKPTYPPVADLPSVAKPVLQTSMSAVTNSWADVAKRPKVHQTTKKSPLYYEQSTKMKRKPARGILMEIGGSDCGQKTDKLATKLREVLSESNVRVNRPVKTGDVRLRDLDNSVGPSELAAAIVEASVSSADDVKVGELRRSPISMGTCWPDWSEDDSEDYIKYEEPHTQPGALGIHEK